MPSLSTLVDNFNDGVIGPDWGNSYGGAYEAGGLAHVPCTTGFAGLQTAYSWTFAGASLFVKVVSVPAASTATDAYCGVLVNSGTDGTRIGFTIKPVTGMLRMQNDVGYFDASAVEIAYDPVAHAFLRLREDGVNVYWDTSPDGATWTNRRTLASPAWIATAIDQCALDMSAHRDAGVSDEATYDLFNTLNNGAVVAGAAGLTADSSIAATATATVHATAGLTADSTLGVTAALAVHGAAALSTNSTLTADADSGAIPEEAELSAGDWDLHIEQGATFVQTFTVTDPGFTWDGWNARSQIRTDAAPDSTLLLDLTPYLTVTGASVRLAIPATETQNLLRNGRWDLEMYQSTTVVRLLQGRVVVSREVTR